MKEKFVNFENHKNNVFHFTSNWRKYFVVFRILVFKDHHSNLYNIINKKKFS